MCRYLGIVQHAQHKVESALVQIDRAKAIDDSNPLVKFNRAMVLVALDRNEEVRPLLRPHSCARRRG